MQMADEAKIGTHWQADELDAIVADYFAMLIADLSGEHYVKSQHNKALMARIGRTHRSVEFKYQNISAVLDELGLPWIPGYIPKRNYQNAIFDAIDRYLTEHPGFLRRVGLPPPKPTFSGEIFVATPPLAQQRIPVRLQHLVRKFDPVERDHRNRSLGRAGEEFVIDVERKRLLHAERPGPRPKNPLDFRRGRGWRRIRYLVVRTERVRAIAGDQDHQRSTTYAVLLDPKGTGSGKRAPGSLAYLPFASILRSTSNIYCGTTA